MRYVFLVMMLVLLVMAGTAGAVVPGNVKLTMVTAPGGKDTKGEKIVKAEALVSQVNTSEQLKEIILGLLDHLKSTYPGCSSYAVVLSDHEKMLSIGNYLAVASFKGGKTEVTGGIPTIMDIRVMKASHVAVRKPDPLGIQVTYDVAQMKKAAKKAGKPLSDQAVYARVAKKHKLQAVQVKQMSREITQYYKAFAGKPF